MKGLSKEADKLIVRFSRAAHNFTLCATKQNAARYEEAWLALETYIRDLEAKVAEKEQQ